MKLENLSTEELQKRNYNYENLKVLFEQHIITFEEFIERAKPLFEE